jgi:exonuclease SbcD
VRIAHVADVHLGHRRYAAVDETGRNQREADVSAAWLASVAAIVAAAPDLILIAGDVFDSPRPGNLAMRDGVSGVQALRKVAPVVVVMGNHDRQKVEEGGVGSPLAVLAQVGAKVVTGAEYVRLPALSTTVFCVAEKYMGRVRLQPNKDEGVQLLLAHGRVSGELYKLPSADCVDPATISPEFRYAALGDFHRCSQPAPNAWYSGSLELVSSNPWQEVGLVKGWLLIDTDEDSVTLNPITTRPHFDLPEIDANGKSGREVSDLILGNIAAIDPAGAVVRQVVTDCHQATKSAIDYRAIKAATSTMLAWRPDIRRPDKTEQAVTVEAEDWIDTFNRDEPLPQLDNYSLADLILAGEEPAIDPETPDPYTEAPRVSAAA